MSFPQANEFLRQTGPLTPDLLSECAKLQPAPSGFERIWAAFEPLDRMQKRGQIARPQSREAWQLLCDEGLGLGGTDWAPPPLAYFAAGLASSITGSVTARLAEHGVSADAVSVVLDNNYSLRGSILRGTMQGKGHDPDVSVSIDGGTLTDKEKSALVLEAVSGGLAGYVMKNLFSSEFSLIANGAPVPLDLPESRLAVDEKSLPTVPLARPESACVSKAFQRPEQGTPINTGTGGGVDPVQDRTFKVTSTARAGDDGTIEMQAGVNQPNAGVYDILGSSDTGVPAAPSSACLIAAGIGFCYMTQLGRYAEATKRPVHDYRMLQSIDIPLAGADGSQTPTIGTKLFLSLDEPDAEFARDLAHSARRTCFLHSTLQESLRSRIAFG
jgi:uncharacterized OsmC-like protein